jgi:hypothetical protein
MVKFRANFKKVEVVYVFIKNPRAFVIMVFFVIS